MSDEECVECSATHRCVRCRIVWARDQGAAEERAAVLAALSAAALVYERREEGTPDPSLKRACQGAKIALFDAASTIHAGDHIKQEAKPNE